MCTCKCIIPRSYACRERIKEKILPKLALTMR